MLMQADGDLVEVSKAVVARIQPALPDPSWEAFWFPPLTHPVPAVLVRPDRTRHADYQGSLSGYTKWMLRLEFHVDATDEESAHTLMGELVSKRGPVIAALRKDDADDALAALCGMNIQLIDGRGWKTTRRKRLIADIGLALGAN